MAFAMLEEEYCNERLRKTACKSNFDKAAAAIQMKDSHRKNFDKVAGATQKGLHHN